MSQIPAMGWLPDIPDINDYTEDTPKVAQELAKTRLAPRVGEVVRGRGMRRAHSG